MTKNNQDTSTQQKHYEDTGKQPWETPVVSEADIQDITEAVGLGNNDGAASHS